MRDRRPIVPWAGRLGFSTRRRRRQRVRHSSNTRSPRWSIRLGADRPHALWPRTREVKHGAFRREGRGALRAARSDRVCRWCAGIGLAEWRVNGCGNGGDNCHRRPQSRRSSRVHGRSSAPSRRRYRPDRRTAAHTHPLRSHLARACSRARAKPQHRGEARGGYGSVAYRCWRRHSSHLQVTHLERQLAQQRVQLQLYEQDIAGKVGPARRHPRLGKARHIP